MKRRTFLQVILGMVTMIFCRSQSHAKENDPIWNGTAWKAPWPFCHIVIVQWWDVIDGESLYVLLSEPYDAADHPGTAMMVCHFDDPWKVNGRYSPFYTEQELARKLRSWEHLPLMMRLAKGHQFQIPREVLDSDYHK